MPNVVWEPLKSKQFRILASHLIQVLPRQAVLVAVATQILTQTHPTVVIKQAMVKSLAPTFLQNQMLRRITARSNLPVGVNKIDLI